MAATVPHVAGRTVMQERCGDGPVGVTCAGCDALGSITGEARISLDGRAHNSKPMTLFQCQYAPDEPWSVEFRSCAMFQRFN